MTLELPDGVPDGLLSELALSLWHIEGNYAREGARPDSGSRFAGQTCEAVQAAYLIRQIWPLAYRAGREDAARNIADHPGPDPSPAIPAWWAGYEEAKRDAAHIARGSA